MTINPYADTAVEYLAAGWNPVPLPYREKSPVPKGVTGYSGLKVTRQMIGSWSRLGRRNIGLRAPEGVIGIDFDAYKDEGLKTFAAAEKRLGKLPPTFRSSARDAPSGIYWFRVPLGRRWVGELGPGVEIVHWGHRFGVAAPSVHPHGMEYGWFDETGAPMADMPHVDELPELPAEWVEALDNGSLHDVDAKTEVSDVAGWVEALPPGDPCRSMFKPLAGAVKALGTEDSGSRHGTMSRAQLSLARMGEQGHAGAAAALDQLETAFSGAVSGDGTRTAREVRGEWERALSGAVAIASATVTPEADRGCCGERSTPADDFTAADVVDVEPQPGSSWAGVDLRGYLDGTIQQITPTLLRREDDVALLYPGLTHSVHGESESGKSMVLQYEAARQLAAGAAVLYADFESDPGSIAGRLLMLGATQDQISERFVYVQPGTDPHKSPGELAAFLATLDAHPYSLAIIDGVSESMDVLGADVKDPNASAIEWARKLPKFIADRTGAAVVQIDHVVKNTESRGRFAIGGQAKMSSLTGAGYALDVRSPLGRGLRGELVLWVAKDRPGYVRGRCGASNADRMQEAARVVVDSTSDTTRVYVEPPPPPGTPGDKTEAVKREISELLAELDDDHEGYTTNTVKEKVSRDKTLIPRALRELVAAGYVDKRISGQRHYHRPVRPYVPEFEGEDQ